MLCFRSSAPEMYCISPQNYFHPVVLVCDTKTFSTAGLVPRNLRVLGWQNTGVCGCKFPLLPDSTSQFSVFSAPNFHSLPGSQSIIMLGIPG